MAIEKQMNGRIIHKHDIEVNWLKATGFIPKQGELIIYDVDENYSYQRYKIGDGITTVSKLPFNEPDWNASEGQAGFIKNRTHYIEKAFEDIEWDGNTTGLVAAIPANASSGGYYKVSDQVPTIDDLLGATLVRFDGAVIEITEQEFYQLDDKVLYCHQPHVIIVSEPTTSLWGDVYPEAGVYFMTYAAMGVYTRSLKAKETVYQLDEKYIPDTIARTVDLVQSDWNQNDPEATDYIKNRTHYEEIYFDDEDQTPVIIDPQTMNDGYILVNRCSSKGRGWFEANYNYDKLRQKGTSSTIYVHIGIAGSTPLLLNTKQSGLSTLELIDSKNYKITNFLGYFDIYVIIQRSTLSEENKINFPEHGIYIKWLKSPYSTWTELSVVLAGTYQINDKYIPSLIARTADVVLTPDAGEIGQTLIVKSVDSAGKPTEWETADLLQSDWEQTDNTKLDFIKNKPDIATDDELIDVMLETDMLPAVTDSDGAIFADEQGQILLW